MERSKIAEILHIDLSSIDAIEADMEKITGKSGVVAKLEDDIATSIEDRLSKLGLGEDAMAEDVVQALTAYIGSDEEALYEHVGVKRSDFEDAEKSAAAFEKIRRTALEVISEKEGFFLKIEKGREILISSPPIGVMEYLGYKTAEELVEKENIEDILSALRFTETTEWMHGTFEKAYSGFKANDFERRDIELRMLGPKWRAIGEKFVAKKHHNVSHLKEFGIIFLNPINQAAHGALMRDFALFTHYFHEIAFYSKLFLKNANAENFSDILKALLRGDVPEKKSVEPGEWLIVQRYLWKEDREDPRLLLPRVNPEALHWHKGEKDMARFGEKYKKIFFEFWDELDWVAGYFPNKNGERILISFDLEDNAMSFVSTSHDKGEYIKYHQQEALWNELFKRYVGEKERDRLLIENFEKGSIVLGS